MAESPKSDSDKSESEPAIRVLIRQRGEPGGVYVEMDDPESCDRCGQWNKRLWVVQRLARSLCTYCFFGFDE